VLQVRNTRDENIIKIFVRRRECPYATTDLEDNDEDAECPYCNRKFSQDRKRRQIGHMI
jgi:uncharacterized Zn-finger protein